MSEPSRPSQRFPGFRVGPIQVDPPLLLAPMEDVTHQPFRRISKQIGGPGLMFTEFVSAMAIHYGAKKTLKKLRIHPSERPLGIQIFGGEAGVMVETAQLAEEMGADLVDVNMGCWVPKVCKTGSGAALLKDPDLAEQIVSAVVRSVKIPVTVKVRAGWDFSLFAAPELARRFEAAGAQMLTLHARFAKQGFDGQADWTLIRDLRKALTIPLVGNGDVKTPADAVRMLAETGCDGVMVGRAAISNPWALARIRACLMGLPDPPPPSLRDRVETALRHAELMVAYEAGVDEPERMGEVDEPSRQDAEVRAIRSLRGLLPIYIKGEHGAASIRSQLTACDRLDQVRDILSGFCAGTTQ